MVKKLVGILQSLKGQIPLVYSLIIIVLVPATLVVNTLWNLRTFERDVDFVVREEALNIQRMFIALAQDQALDSDFFQQAVFRIQQHIPKIAYVTILEPEGREGFKIAAATDIDSAQYDARNLLNNLAWQENRSYFTQSYDPKIEQNIWMVVTPLTNAAGEKVALVNFKIDSSRVSTVLTRTTRDSIIILLISVLLVVLLLVNHVRFFEQSLLYEQLKEINQMKDDFISVASHELRTPLTAIKGYLAMVEKDFKGKRDTKTSKRMTVIKQSVERLETLVHDLLNVSRIEQNRLDFTLSAVNSTQIIQETVNQLLPVAQDKSLKLIFDEKPHVPLVLAHPDRLREVLVNLIGNAIKYTLKGEVLILQETEKDKVKIFVKDTGIGIAPEDQERLFQKFSRIQTDQARDVPGTGLGLWITKQLVERMQGKLYLNSIKGKGTEVTVILQQANSSS